MTDSDISLSLARKSFASSLWILVIVQIVGLCVSALGFLMQEFPIFGALVPDGLVWQDGIAMFTAFGVCLFVGAAIGACHVLSYSKIVPLWIQNYGSVGCLLMYVCCLLTFLSWLPFLFPLAMLLACFLFLGYCPIPQFYIARWLANAAESDAMPGG